MRLKGRVPRKRFRIKGPRKLLSVNLPKALVWVKQPSNFKFRGKSKRKRFFFNWQIGGMHLNKAQRIYPVGTKFLTPSNLTWAPQNPLMRSRKMKPRKRFMFNWKSGSMRVAKPPHTIFPPRQPSNLTWSARNPLLRRKMRPRARFFLRWKWLKSKPPHTDVFIKPSNLSWVQLKQVSRKQMRPRKRFRIAGRWPNMPSKMHIISYHVLPITQWIVVGPGKLKKRSVQPSLEAVERATSPKLQK